MCRLALPFFTIDDFDGSLRNKYGLPGNLGNRRMVGMGIDGPKGKQCAGSRSSHDIRHLPTRLTICVQFAIKPAKEGETRAEPFTCRLLFLLPDGAGLAKTSARQSSFTFGRTHQMKVELLFQKKRCAAYAIGEVIRMSHHKENRCHSLLPASHGPDAVASTIAEGD